MASVHGSVRTRTPSPVTLRHVSQPGPPPSTSRPRRASAAAGRRPLAASRRQAQAARATERGSMVAGRLGERKGNEVKTAVPRQQGGHLCRAASASVPWSFQHGAFFVCLLPPACFRGITRPPGMPAACLFQV